MSKVVLIEDRINRQANKLGSKLGYLERHSNLNNISGGVDFEYIKNKLTKLDFTVLEEYSVIMLHRSAFDSNTRNAMLEFMKKTNKKAVFFSGGISGCQINRIGEFEFLLINVNDFYGDNLLLFLENDAHELLELAFGKNWQISILMDTYEKLTLYTKSFTNEDWDYIEEDLQLNEWVKDKFFEELQQKKRNINKADLEKVLHSMNDEIKNLL